MREQGNYSITELCDAFGVSKSGYYAARSPKPNGREREEAALINEIEQIHADRHTRVYGSPRMTTELNARNLPCSENRVARIMAKYSINASQKAAFRPKTTISDPDKMPAPNRLKELSEPSSPGEVYVSDITYVATREGWLYLAVVLDLYSRKVAGWALAEHMETGLVSSALSSAISNVRPADGAIFHSDRGCQYTSAKMRKDLKLLGIKQSMSAKGNCYDNAKSESFFATIKREAFPDNCCFDSISQAKTAIFDYIETFYNRRRRHSTLGNISPESFLTKHFQNQQQHLN